MQVIWSCDVPPRYSPNCSRDVGTHVATDVREARHDAAIALMEVGRGFDPVDPAATVPQIPSAPQINQRWSPDVRGSETVVVEEGEGNSPAKRARLPVAKRILCEGAVEERAKDVADAASQKPPLETQVISDQRGSFSPAPPGESSGVGGHQHHHHQHHHHHHHHNHHHIVPHAHQHSHGHPHPHSDAHRYARPAHNPRHGRVRVHHTPAHPESSRASYSLERGPNPRQTTPLPHIGYV